MSAPVVHAPTTSTSLATNALSAHLRRTRDIENGFYEGMLVEDVGYILPFGRGLDEDFTATIVGSTSDDLRTLIAEALPSQFDRSVLEEALRDFMQHVSTQVVGWGECTFEVEYLMEAAGDGDPVAFRLAPLYPGSLGRRWRKPIQYVPRNAAEATTRDGLGFVHLDPQHLIKFSLPRVLHRDVRRAVRFLSAASDQQRNEFALVQQSMTQRTHYDVRAHHRLTGELVLRATRAIGWNARGLQREHVLDPYAVWRQLRFNRFKVQVRDVILAQLNDALRRIGDQFGFEARIELAGVSTLADVDAQLASIAGSTTNLVDLTRSSF